MLQNGGEYNEFVSHQRTQRVHLRGLSTSDRHQDYISAHFDLLRFIQRMNRAHGVGANLRSGFAKVVYV